MIHRSAARSAAADKNLAFAAIAGGTSAVVPRYSGPYDVLRSIYKERGIVGWYKGLVPMAWR